MATRRLVARYGRVMVVLAACLTVTLSVSVLLAATGYWECDMTAGGYTCPGSCTVGILSCPVGCTTCNVTQPAPALGVCVKAWYLCDIGNCPGTCAGYPNDGCMCYGGTMSCD